MDANRVMEELQGFTVQAKGYGPEWAWVVGLKQMIRDGQATVEVSRDGPDRNYCIRPLSGYSLPILEQ